MAEDFRYVSFDSEETWNAMQRAYVAAGGDILYPGDEKEMLLRGVLAIGVGLLGRIDTALRMDTLTYATGDFLKLYGEKRGCVYLDASPATVTLRVTFRETGVEKTIPAGTALTADGTLTWTLDEDLEQTGLSQTVDVTATCTSAGEAGNGLVAGAQLRFLTGETAVTRVIAFTDATGGADAEDEETYRERIREYGLAPVTTGPKEMYEAKARAVSSQIIDCQAVNGGAGVVNIYLLLADGADSAEIIREVDSALSSDDTRPLTDTVSIALATEAAYTIGVSCEYSTLNVSAEEIADVVAAYQSWQDNTIARAFNPDRLTAALYQIGVDRVTYSAGSGMDGSMAYTEIGDGAHCKGTITIS